jgi:hypothetical protein
MARDRELDRLVALLEEHGLLPGYDSEELINEEGHSLIYARVRATPLFPMDVDDVRELLERPRATGRS